MGIRDWALIKLTGTIASISGAAERYYEPQLKSVGLGKDDIQSQTLPDLEKSLQKVDDAILRKDTFGTVRFKATPDGQIVVSTTDEGIETSIGPTLLARKALIVERMRQLRTIEDVGSLRNIVEANVAEPAKAKIIEKIEKVEREASEWREKVQEIEDAQKEEKLKLDAELVRMEAEGKLFERRAAVWQTFLARESVASVVGSILLLVIAMGLLIAMFTGIQTTEIVGNAFLVLLGYFFGKTDGRKPGEGGS